MGSCSLDRSRQDLELFAEHVSVLRVLRYTAASGQVRQTSFAELIRVLGLVNLVLHFLVQMQSTTEGPQADSQAPSAPPPLPKAVVSSVYVCSELGVQSPILPLLLSHLLLPHPRLNDQAARPVNNADLTCILKKCVCAMVLHS